MLERVNQSDESGIGASINKAASEAFFLVSQTLQKPVGPDSEQCFSIVWAMRQKLRRAFPLLSPVYTRLFYPNGFYKEHVFLRLPYKDKVFAVDPTYQQFLDEEEKRAVPSVAVMPADSFEELSLSLSFHQIPKEHHSAWLKPIFPDRFRTQNKAGFWYNRESKYTSFLG
ncbi:hypothetical protein C4578_03510 [Candidatus Microgenomates bacterium]|jgi:hypothetical protein|nr:MAG: hypothetical protein C4578_03510 [Candidatus Microgenomates bacterium]